MYIKNYRLFLAFALCAGFSAFAQEKSLTANSHRSPQGFIRCVSSEYEQSLQSKFPARNTEKEFEDWIAPLIEKEKNKRTAQDVNTVSTIPVVVHVIYNTASTQVGTGANISAARVASQITVLNQDFRRAVGTPGFNDNAVGADTELEFCLAQRDPSGAATTGIDRVAYGVSSFATTDAVETMKTATQWDPDQYFNIWVVAFSTSSSAELGGVLGYAQFPQSSGLAGLGNETSASTDGVVIDYRCFGTSDLVTSTNYFDSYDKGRTSTHEIGHCFGLRHIWGDTSSCTVNATDSQKDYCLDTPAQNTEHYDCASIYDTCTANAGNDMTDNYMDYTNDTCMDIFTINQKARLTAVMNNSPRRSTLKTSNACQAPLSTEEFKFFDQIKIYPNPAKDMLNIKSSNSELPDAYTVFNNLGQVVAYQRVKSESDMSMNVASFQTGIYYVRVWKGENVKTYQMIKE